MIANSTMATKMASFHTVLNQSYRFVRRNGPRGSFPFSPGDAGAPGYGAGTTGLCPAAPSPAGRVSRRPGPAR